MKPMILFALGLTTALLASGCGHDDDFNKGDRNNYPIYSNTGQQQPGAVAPVIILDTGTLASTRGAAGVAFSPGATISDTDTAILQNGVLTISASNGLLLTSPGTPDIGVVTGGGTNAISVALNGNATLANLQQFMRSVTVASNGVSTVGANTITVGLSDGTGQTSQNATRNINVI